MMDAEDDDDMADLFSFGMDGVTPPASPTTMTTTTTIGGATPSGSNGNMNNVAPTTINALPKPPDIMDMDDKEMEDLFNDTSDDSFLRMLDEHPLPLSPNRNGGGATAAAAEIKEDPETQDILNWLDEDDTDADALLAAVADESAQKIQQQQQQQAEQQKKKQQQQQPEQPPLSPPSTQQEEVQKYESIQEVLESSESTKIQILEQWEKPIEKSYLQDTDPKLRPLLWSRIICGKSLDDLSSTSLADSFQTFLVKQQEKKNRPTNGGSSTTTTTTTNGMKIILSEEEEEGKEQQEQVDADVDENNNNNTENCADSSPPPPSPNNNNNNNGATASEEEENWIRSESIILAPRIVRTNPNGMTVTEAEEALQSILLYHYHSNSNCNSNNKSSTTTTTAAVQGHDTDNNNNKSAPTTSPANPAGGSSPDTHDDHDDDDDDDETKAQLKVVDPILPPVVCAILGAGVPAGVTPVLMSHIIPSFMPFVALTPEERWEASKLLHSQFYLLACYHLPMLVYHLDRYVPGWYWPSSSSSASSSSSTTTTSNGTITKKEEENNDDEKENHHHHHYHLSGRHPQTQGIIPPSWLMTHLVGECGGTFLDPDRLLRLLDLVFTNENNSLRFFLVLAVLEQHSDSWLELTGDELVDSLHRHMRDSTTSSVEEWATRARAMKQSTPDSVVDRLRVAEDEAVRLALKERQKRAEAALKARLEAEAAAHREAQERKAEEARTRLTRARLVAYYRKFNPTKEANIDKIMEAYKDNFDILDAKLKKKYGVGFNPAINPKKKRETTTTTNTTEPAPATTNFLRRITSSSSGTATATTTTTLPPYGDGGGSPRADNPLGEDEDTDEIRKKEHRVSVSVKVSETLPYICMTREQANDIRRTCLQKDLPMPLRFYLVDCRSEEVAGKQGRFPTAARLSPESLLDPELMQKYEDSFESVRGSYHICVMGEGYSSIPALYNLKLTPAMEEYMREDEARTNDCALFFVKRGFPFVSVLEGGFASAHAWLRREGPKKGFQVKLLLVDYKPEVSLFGQMEKIKKEQPVAYKAQRAMRGLLEASIPDSVRNRSAMGGRLAEGEAGPNAESSGKKLQRKASDDAAAARGPLSFFGRRQQGAADSTGATGEMKDDSGKAGETRIAGFFRRQQATLEEEVESTNNASSSEAHGPGAAIGAGFFGRRQQAATSETQTTDSNQNSSEAPQPPSIGAGFFGRRQQQVAPETQPTDNKITSEEKTESTATTEETPTPDPSPESAPEPAATTAQPPAPAPVPASQPQPQTRFGRWRQAAEQAAPVAGNRLGGAIGRLRQASQETTGPQRRNPFARFGGGGGNNAGATGPPPGSEAARAAMSTASSAFGGLMNAANNARTNYARSASNETGTEKPKEQQQQQQQQLNGGTVISLPPRPDEDDQGEKNQSPKREPTLKAV